MKIAIIGGGPSGLTTLKYLVTAHEYFGGLESIEARLFEAEKDIGGTFRYRTYSDSELVSSKYLTTFSDHRFPASAPDFATPESYLAYLRGYVAKFRLTEYIECSTRVVKVSRAGEGGHSVRIHKVRPVPVGDDSNEGSRSTCDRTPVSFELEDWRCDAVVVCSGFNVTPNLPDIPGLEVTDGKLDKAKCRVIHSSAYKASDFFDGAKTVAILGAGETAMDVGYQAVNHPDVQKVVMCSRDGFLVAPKITPEPVILGVWGKPYPGKPPNKPIDTTIASLFDTMYVPPSIQRGPLLWLYYDRWIKYIFFLISGTSQGIDQWVGGVHPRRRHADALFFVKSDKAVPYMSARHRKGFWNSVRKFFINIPIKDTGDRVIDVKSFPTHVCDNGIMHIPEHDSDVPYKIKPEAIVLATGYSTEFPFLQEGQYPTPEQARVRGVYRYIEEGFAYIGFIRPSIGAIPPLAELQAQLWVYRWLQHFHGNKLVRKKLSKQPDEGVIPPYELDYALHARGNRDFFATKRGVDHESYAFQLALDMGAAPSFWHMVRKHGWRCLYTWAMGPNFNTKFRLVGPWANPALAVPIMEGELFGVVKRTGGWFFFATYTLLPFVLFGALSLAFMLLNQVAETLKWLWGFAFGSLLGGGDAEKAGVKEGRQDGALASVRTVE